MVTPFAFSSIGEYAATGVAGSAKRRRATFRDTSTGLEEDLPVRAYQDIAREQVEAELETDKLWAAPSNAEPFNTKGITGRSNLLRNRLPPDIVNEPVPHNYLAERRQYAVCNGVSPETSHVTSGVPQGSILGPLLFLIYIDDITQVNLSAESKFVLNADDILLYRPIRSSEDYPALQADIEALSSWSTLNALTSSLSASPCLSLGKRATIFHLHLCHSMELFLR